jgi:hypothetical protein
VSYFSISTSTDAVLGVKAVVFSNEWLVEETSQCKKSLAMLVYLFCTHPNIMQEKYKMGWPWV